MDGAQSHSPWVGFAGGGLKQSASHGEMLKRDVNCALVGTRPRLDTRRDLCRMLELQKAPLRNAEWRFCLVRQAWRVARKRERIGYGGQFVDLAVQVRCRP
jgi:hypothetical protein